MLALSIQTPHDRASPPVGEIVAQAVQEAGAVSGAFSAPPCQFHLLGPEADALAYSLRPETSGPGAWVLVTSKASAEVDHRAHLRERCRTAAQRFVLTLACEGIESVWVEQVPDAAAFRAAGVDVGSGEPVGLVWCAAG